MQHNTPLKVMSCFFLKVVSSQELVVLTWQVSLEERAQQHGDISSSVDEPIKTLIHNRPKSDLQLFQSPKANLIRFKRLASV